MCACNVLLLCRVLLLVAGAVVRCCVLCWFLWCSVVRCLVWWAVVVCWWRVSVLMSLSGRAVCFHVVGAICCGALLPCVVSCGAELLRSSHALPLFCGALCACFALLWPVVRRCAVLCRAFGCLCCSLPGGGVCVLWCPFFLCWHATKKLIITLCYPAPVSVSMVHVLEESSLPVRRFVADPGGVVFDGAVVFGVSGIDGAVST